MLQKELVEWISDQKVQISIKLNKRKSSIQLTILLFISWKWISQTLSTTSSLWNVTNPNPAKKMKKKEDKKKLYTYTNERN